MSKYFVHSTSSQDMKYCIFADDGHGKSTPIKEITIFGNANVVNPRTLESPTGVVTEVSEVDYELLKKNPHFQRHCAKGFLKVMPDVSQLDTSDLQKRDNSSQLQDYEYAKGLDARVPNSGMCQASCGERDAIVGEPGIGFKAEIR